MESAKPLPYNSSLAAGVKAAIGRQASEEPMRILLTNDDGVNAPGLAALRDAIADLGEVAVVAPDTEQSGVAHSITLIHPLRVRKVYHGQEFFGYGVSGAPADCVKLACRELLAAPPDLVCAGLNLGANVAINILYSGTVAAAIEGAILGFPSVAFSLAETERPDFPGAAAIAREVLGLILAEPLPERAVLNVNIPGLPCEQVRGIRVTHQSSSTYRETFEKRHDPWGKAYFWITGGINDQFLREPDSDLLALREGYVSVTPIHFDLTHYPAIEPLRRRLSSLQRFGSSPTKTA